jgi:choline dehydrogenase-like flavoprotein
MLHDTAGTGRAAFDRIFDVCVIGSGFAGITIARALGARGHSVALMEAGGLAPTDESQDLYRGEITGIDTHPLDTARLRFFGGTSGHWGGHVRPLDAAAFSPRAGHPGSGWPIAKTDLDPYFAETARILDIADPDFSDLDTLPPDSPFREIPSVHSPPTQMGPKYLDEITASQTIHLGINANLVDLRLAEPDLARVEAAVFRSYDPGDPGFAVRARAYALCTGGIENARLLLNFTSQKPAGIGNEHGLVGRHFMDHPNAYVGEMIYAVREEGQRRYVPGEAFLARNRTLPAFIVTSPRERREMSLVVEAVRDIRCHLPFADRLAEAVLGRPAICDTGGLAEWYRARDPENNPWGRVFIHSEQSLNRDSCVTLSGERDALGLFRPRLHWAMLPRDYRSMRVNVIGLAEDLARRGIGRMRIADWLLAEEPHMPDLDTGMGPISSWHHIGTTRMSDDPRHGVVDRNCRVHDCENLYIGGSSVFATSGFASPTFTIVQLALRLGDHLDKTLS